MSGRLNKLRDWLLTAAQLGVEAIVVHDFRDQETADELSLIFREIGSSSLFLITGEYGSAGLARNAGMEQANGHWLVFWDSDDMPDLEVTLQVINEDSALTHDAIICNFQATNENTGTKKIRKIGKDPYLDIALTPGIWRFIFRRTSVGGIRFPSLRIGEDQYFLSLFNLENRDLLLCEKVNYNYFFGTQNHQTKSKEARIDIITLLELTSKMILTNPVQSRFLDLQFCRQFLTGLKMLEPSLTIRTVGKAGALICLINKSRRKDIFSSLIELLRMDRDIL
jgi:glycosyltransferase involved in cell wall biosynthesis